jgi:hypothetical protein
VSCGVLVARELDEVAGLIFAAYRSGFAVMEGVELLSHRGLLVQAREELAQAGGRFEKGDRL